MNAFYRWALLTPQATPNERAIEHCLHALGHEAKIFSSDDFEKSHKDLNAFQPDFILTENFHPFDPQYSSAQSWSEYCSHKDRKLISWFVDAPFFSGSFLLQKNWLTGKYPKHALYLSHDRVAQDFFKERELQSEHLPLAVDPRLFKFKIPPGLRKRFSHDLAYTGRVLSVNAAEFKGAPADIYYTSLFLNEWSALPLVMEDLHDWPSFEMLVEMIFEDFLKFLRSRALMPRDFKAQLDHFLSSARAHLPEIVYNTVQLRLGRIYFYYSNFQLVDFVQLLLEKNIKVYGSEIWRDLLPGYLEPTPRLSEEEMFSLFGSSKLMFCLTKHHFFTAVQERVFQIFALNGFPLVDWREELDEMFSKGEVVSYRSYDEAKSLIDFYQKNESERQKIIQKGHERVSKDHTYLHRTEKLVRFAENFWGLQ